MINFIFSMHPFFLRVSFFIVIAVIVFFSAMIVKRHVPQNNNDVDAVAGVSGLISTMYAIFLGFLVFISFDNLNVASSAAKAEANTVGTISYNASFFSDSLHSQVQRVLHNYLENVINKEWPAMIKGEANNAAVEQLKQLKALVYDNRPVSGDEVALTIWTETLNQVNALFQQHENRLSYSQNLSLDTGILYCLIVTTLALLVSIACIHFDDPVRRGVMLVVLVVVFAVLLFLEMNINFPYRGYYRVTSHDLEVVQQQLSYW